MEKILSKRLLGNISRYSVRVFASVTILFALLIGYPGTSVVLAATNTVAGPSLLKVFAGPYNPNSSPPSDTIAASSSREVTLVNGYINIANRSGVGTTNTLNNLVDDQGVNLTDQQVMWDPSSGRFYFSMQENRGTTTPDEGIAWGFSKTSTPNTVSDFCTYFNNFNYGSTSFPDRQTLGDTQNFLLMASDRFSTSNYSLLGSDVAWITKPGPGTSCPAQSSFTTGVQSLHNADGTAPYAPVASRQVDPSTTGWVISTPYYYGSANYISTYKVTRNASTGSAIIGPVNTLPVPAYSVPPTAPQAGETETGESATNLQTDVYFSGAYMAYDPRVAQDVLWTTNTIAGGAGSEVRWYEINPTVSTLYQYGTISNPSLYTFNASIAPDRLVDGSVARFGSDAVVGFNTSSTKTFTEIQMVGIVATTQTPMQLVTQSPGPNIDYTCNIPGYGYCRWGDDSGASPDPGAPYNRSYKKGQVWLVNQWNATSTNDQSPVWRITIWASKP